MAKALRFTERSELPRWAEPLRPEMVALGVARWMFTGLSHGLPLLPAPPEQYALPSREEQPKYWEHIDWLMAESARRTQAGLLA